MTTTPQPTVEPVKLRQPETLADAIAFYLTSRGSKSPHTLKAYRSDLAILAENVAALFGKPADQIPLADAMTQSVVQTAFNKFCLPDERSPRSKSSVNRGFSTFNTFSTYLVKHGWIDTNPMQLIEREEQRGTPPPPPKAIEQDDLERMLFQLATPDPDDPNAWRERDLALILAGVLTGMRASELIALNVGSFTPIGSQPDARTIEVFGKGGKYRVLTAEPDLVRVFEMYLESRAARWPDQIPQSRRRRRSVWDKFPPDAPFFVGAKGDRITRGTLQYRTQRAFKRAGIAQTPGANTHRLRHSFAIYLADNSVPVHTLAALLGHSTLHTAMRYLEASGKATREAASRNPIYAATHRIFE